MSETTRLYNILQTHLPWHRARLTFVASFILALIKVRTVTFGRLALVLSPQATPSSNYRRIQRFFAHFPVSTEPFGRLMLTLLPQEDAFVVTIDRSNWQLGQHPINILMLSVAYKGIAFPVVWTLLGKAGNSNRQERRWLIERFLGLVDKEHILAVVADREFIGEGWCADLKRFGLSFYIRIRRNARVGSKGRTRPAWSYFDDLPLEVTRVLSKRCWVYGHRLFLAGLRLEDDELILATNARPRRAFVIYAQRWQIETLFAALKTRGFNLEASHLRHDRRIEKLLALLAIAFAWAHLVGEWLHQHRPIPIKKHGRLAKSFFRYGLDHLQFVLLNISYQQAELLRCLRCLSTIGVLSCT